MINDFQNEMLVTIAPEKIIIITRKAILTTLTHDYNVEIIGISSTG